MSSADSLNNLRQQPEDDSIDITEYLGLLIENRWLIIGVTLLCFLAGLAYAMFATPIYRADALVQIEEGKGRAGAGDELAAMMGQDGASSAATEIEIITSRSVIGSVVSQQGLTISAAPVRFPLIGGFIARRHSGAPAAPLLGLSEYAWGGERLTVSRLDVAGGTGAFTLVALDQGHYELRDQNDTPLLRGVVGEAAASADGRVRLFVSELVARSGTHFRVKKHDPYAVLQALQAQIRVEEKGRRTGLLSISLEGADRERIRNIIHGLTQSYLRQNVERRSEESEQMLAFIQSQMPAMRTDLDAAEQALNQYREQAGTIDLSMESQNLIQRITGLETEISNLGIQRTELLQKLTASHPVIQGMDEKIRHLKSQIQELNKQLKTVPEKELESVKLSRDVTVASELYMLLLNKAQELKVTKAGTLGNVRIVDEAVTGRHPIKPKKFLVVALSLLLGLVFGIVLAVLRMAINKTVQDPAVIEKQLGYSVYAEVPFSAFQAKASKSSHRKGAGKSPLLAQERPDEQVVESLRSLRTSLQFALMEAENNLVTITGVAPDAGKSFVSANFAYVLADSGKKVLLIDADLRKGHLETYFDTPKSPGLSEALSGEHDIASVVHRGQLHANLDFLSSGIYPPNPSELLMSEAFKTLLATAKTQYDLVIIDTPPILAVTDPAIVAQYSSTNFMVLRAGEHRLREIQAATRRFEQNGVHIRGVILNGIEIMKGRYAARYGYSYKYYGYQYDYKADR